MNKLKKIGAMALAFASSVPAVLADAVTVDVTAANDAADAIGTALSGLITGKILTNVLLVVGAGLAIWGIFLVVKYVRRGAK